MAIFTGRIERATALALRAHESQVRKGDGHLPYVVHPVTVALILTAVVAVAGPAWRATRIDPATALRTD